MLGCAILSRETNGLHHAEVYFQRSIIYSLPTHPHTQPSGSPGFAVNRQWFAPSLCPLCSAQMVSMRFIWPSAPSRAHSPYRIITEQLKKCLIKKKYHAHARTYTRHRFLKSAAHLCLQPGERLNFSHASHATAPPSTERSALPQGCNNILLHLPSLYDPATLHLAPLKPMLTVIENTQICHLSFLSSVLCYLQTS